MPACVQPLPPLTVYFGAGEPLCYQELGVTTSQRKRLTIQDTQAGFSTESPTVRTSTY